MPRVLLALCLGAAVALVTPACHAEKPSVPPESTPVERTCGPRGAATCGPDELCDFAPDAKCGDASAGRCIARPQICTRIFKPVCGCDGRTWPSACTARGEGVAIRSEGECPAAPGVVPAKSASAADAGSSPPCGMQTCKAGQRCELVQVQCIRAPCPPIPECVPDEPPVQCGKTACGSGQFCCNAACGLCLRRGAKCDQHACP